jgi:predicted nucleic acid-binding Zn ribbon protein
MDEKVRENNRLRQRKFLELHKDEVNSKRRERYHERISLGKCPRCGGRIKKGHTLCTNCCDYMLDLNRKYAKQKKAASKTVKAALKTKTAKKKPKAKTK